MLNKNATKNLEKILFLKHLFDIMLVDTFEFIRCFPFQLSNDKRKVVVFMTKREFSQFIIILLLFLVVIILLLK